MACVLLRDALLLDPEASAPAPGSLLVEDGRIRARLSPGEAAPPDARVVELAGRALSPGFVDLHFHGALVFAVGPALAPALAATSRALAREGTTAFLATTVAWPAGQLGERVSHWCASIDALPAGGAVPIGLHLEGPWIHPEAAGAQPRDAVRDCDPREAADVLARGEGRIRMVTLAPELPGAPALQDALARRGVVAALGHSLADAEEARRAVERGAGHVTHLFNAMGPMHQRRPGLAGAALAEDRLTCDLICDGVHVHPDWVRLAARAVGERLVLITDRVDPPDDTSFGAGPVRSDGRAIRFADGRLAGSCLGLDRALRNAQDFADLSLLEAVAACTLRPARVLGIEAERGTLRPNARADLVVLDGEARVEQTWVGGERVV